MRFFVSLHVNGIARFLEAIVLGDIGSIHVWYGHLGSTGTWTAKSAPWRVGTALRAIVDVLMLSLQKCCRVPHNSPIVLNLVDFGDGKA